MTREPGNYWKKYLTKKNRCFPWNFALRSIQNVISAASNAFHVRPHHFREPMQLEIRSLNFWFQHFWKNPEMMFVNMQCMSTMIWIEGTSIMSKNGDEISKSISWQTDISAENVCAFVGRTTSTLAMQHSRSWPSISVIARGSTVALKALYKLAESEFGL